MERTIEEETYKHAQDTMYVITDSENLGDNKVVYPGQIVTQDENDTKSICTME